MEELLNVFDSWNEVLVKARQPKGLAAWKKLESVAGKLTGKQASDITFTCAHPSHNGEAVRHVLGSSTGSLHFLQGYGNPAFFLADYHWNVIDPNLDEKHIKELDHPSKPELWRQSGLPMIDEGDLKEGKPHPGVEVERQAAKKEEKINTESVRAKNNYAEYLGIPSMGLVFGLHNKQTYKWDIVKNSFFAAINTDFTEAMNEVEEERNPEIDEEVTKSLNNTTESFNEDEVFSLVYNSFPVPGSVVPMNLKSETIYGVVTTKSIDFYDSEGNRANILVYDRLLKSLDLRRDGDCHPGVILNFATNYLNLDVANDQEEIPYMVKGLPTEGFEDYDYSINTERVVEKVLNGWLRK